MGLSNWATGVADYRQIPIEALFLEFGDPVFTFRVRWWLESYVYTRRMFDKVNTTIYKGLGEAGIEIPFSQRVISYKTDSVEGTEHVEAFPSKNKIEFKSKGSELSSQSLLFLLYVRYTG